MPRASQETDAGPLVPQSSGKTNAEVYDFFQNSFPENKFICAVSRIEEKVIQLMHLKTEEKKKKKKKHNKTTTKGKS